MEVSASSSQSAALANYITVQNQREREQVASRPETGQEAQRTQQSRDQVNLSPEAQRLARQPAPESAQPPEQTTQREAVQATRETPNPQENRAATARSVNQAINAYLEASVIS